MFLPPRLACVVALAACVSACALCTEPEPVVAVAPRSAIVGCAPSTDQVAHARELYVADVFEIADVPEREDALFAQTAAHGITRLTLYGHRVLLLDTPDGEGRLRRFIERARAHGIRSLGAPVGWNGELHSLAAYMRANPGASFDELVTEIEYWNECDSPPDADRGATRPCFEPLRAMLEDMAALREELVHDGHPSVRLAAYLGWPSAEEARVVAALADRVLLHCEQADPDLAYDHSGTARGASSRGRLRDLAGRAEVWPIFYARGETNMGAWIGAHGIDVGEEIWITRLTDEREPWACALRVGGFTYFDHRGLAAVEAPQ
jgi:hypothetical protein